MCIVRVRHKEKTAKCRFFVVPGDVLVLLGMPDIEVLDMLKIMSKVMGDPDKSRMFDYQKMQASYSSSCKAKILNRSRQIVWM